MERGWASVRYPPRQKLIVLSVSGCLPGRFTADSFTEYLVAEGWRGLDIRVSLVWKSDLGSDQIERRRGPEQSRRRRYDCPDTIMLSLT